MNGFWLLLPFLAVRFGLLLIIRKGAIQRAGYFAPVQGTEKIAYYIYQVSNIGLFLYLLVTAVKIDFSLYFYLLYWYVFINTVFDTAWNGNNISSFSSLDYSFRRKMVYKEIW